MLRRKNESVDEKSIVFSIAAECLRGLCIRPVREVISADKHLRFNLSYSFRQTDKDSPAFTSFTNGRYQLKINTYHKDLYEHNFRRFQAAQFNHEQLIYFDDILRLRSDIMNVNGYPIVTFYGDGEDPSGFGTMYRQGYAYAVETPNFYVRVRLVYSARRMNAMDRIEAETYMRPLLESLTQIM